MTRDEHIKWCKQRAIAEFDFYQSKDGTGFKNGITSMMSDLMKHDETKSVTLQSLCMMQMMTKPRMSRQEFVNFINGFN